jgi:hypothetical protein
MHSSRYNHIARQEGGIVLGVAQRVVRRALASYFAPLFFLGVIGLVTSAQAAPTIDAPMPVAEAPTGSSEAVVAAASPCEASPSETSDSPSTACSDRRELDEVWMMTTRGMGCLCPSRAEQPTPRVYRRVDNQWVASDLKEFLDSTNADKPLIFFAHGNRMSYGESKSAGMSVYRALVRPADTPPIRFVLWAWPTDPIQGYKVDALQKGSRANSEAYYLGWVLSQVNPQQKVALLGYSFGARIAAGAMHLNGGGSVLGYSLDDEANKTSPMRLVLMAAAVDNTALAAGRKYGLALERADAALFLNNGCDRALKHYWRLDKCSCPQALGYTGLAGPVPAGAQLRQINVCCEIGSEHYWKNYFYTPSVARRIRDYALFDDLP